MSNLITQQQYDDLQKENKKILWVLSQRRKNEKQIQKNQAVFNNNIKRLNDMLKGKPTVQKYDSGYEEPYDQQEQENGK